MDGVGVPQASGTSRGVTGGGLRLLDLPRFVAFPPSCGVSPLLTKACFCPFFPFNVEVNTYDGEVEGV